MPGTWLSTADSLNPTLPTGAIAQTFDRYSASCVNLAAHLVSGTLMVSAIYLRSGQVASAATFRSGGTALSTATNQWACLLDADRVVRAVSANGTSGAWAGNAAKTFTFGAAYTVPSTGWYYVGLMVAATTVPSIIGISDGYTDVSGIAPVLSASSSTGQTSPPALAATMGAFTAKSQKAWAYLT